MSDTQLLRPRLLDMHDVMQSCKVGRDRAFELMALAGRIKLGRSLRCRPEDLDAVLEQLKTEGAG